MHGPVPEAPRVGPGEAPEPGSDEARETALRRLFDGRGILFGADHNPEPWDEDVWRDG